MNRTLINSIFGTIFLITSFMGFVQGDKIAHNIAFVYAWMCIIFAFSLTVVTEDTVADFFKKGPSIPRALDITADIAVVIMLLLDPHNHWITALLFICQIFLVDEGFKIARKQKEIQLNEEKIQFNFHK